MPAYLDNAATTRVCPEATRAALEAMTEGFGNPSARYAAGQAAAARVAEHRAAVARRLGCDPAELTFTSCGTEGDNWAVRAAAEHGRRRGRQRQTATLGQFPQQQRFSGQPAGQRHFLTEQALHTEKAQEPLQFLGFLPFRAAWQSAAQGRAAASQGQGPAAGQQIELPTAGRVSGKQGTVGAHRGRKIGFIPQAADKFPLMFRCGNGLDHLTAAPSRYACNPVPAPQSWGTGRRMPTQATG